MSFFAELKRRNVVRVGIAYVVGGWLLLQLTEVLSELLKLPDEIGPIVVAIVAIGLPIALFFAWAYELTPEGVKRESDVDRSQSITPTTGKKLNNTILVMMALAIAYLLYDKFSGGRPEAVSTPAVEVAETTSTQKTAPAPDSPTSRQSIAVLPFDNRSEQTSDQFFVEGIHDDLLTNLARIGSLKVISRTSVNRYQDTNKSIPEIARELGVSTVMEGAVQRSGDMVRINVQLIDAYTDEHLWAEIFDRKLTAENLFAIQSEISEAIAGALQATLSPEESRRINTQGTENLAAYEAYMRGRQLVVTRISSDIEQAIGDFRTAVTLDPEFALAWVGLADAQMLLATYGTLSTEDAIRIGEQAARQALALDDQLGEAHAALANVYDLKFEQQEAERLFRRAIELSPNYASAWHWYANLLGWQPLRSEERLQLAQKAAELDPNSSIIQLSLASAYGGLGLYELREQTGQRVIELEPGFARGYRALAGWMTFSEGRFDEALPLIQKAIELDPGNINNMATLTAIYNSLGDEAAYREVLERMEDLGPDHWWSAFINVLSNKIWGSPEATREAIAWALPRMQGTPDFGYIIAKVAVAADSPQRGLEIYLHFSPEWAEPDEWQSLLMQYPEHACTVAWLLNINGNPELGGPLMDQTMAYFDELSTVTRNKSRFRPQICHLALGDIETALTLMEDQLERNVLFNWEIDYDMPLFDVIRNEPRYQAMISERQRRLDAQRANVNRLRAEGVL